MRTTCKLLIIILFSTAILSCGKNKKTDQNEPLTGCPVNSSCTYNFTNKADIGQPAQIVAGDNRVFAYNAVNNNLCNASAKLYFKTGLSNADFSISSSQITSGQVLYNFTCPCCDYISQQPVGGEIKGTMVGSGKWLVKATVLLGNPSVQRIDTLKINQYFTVK
ncbi:hypothetical protein AAFN85_17975 [Mucilaginibacter sp. CAU 1740]|uniref:hypothetical protein n=1 Tax=Mucilaginibacter sp. CAU 1740 TaxID=3140365 RepID=UPI00325BE830